MRVILFDDALPLTTRYVHHVGIFAVMEYFLYQGFVYAIRIQVLLNSIDLIDRIEKRLVAWLTLLYRCTPYDYIDPTPGAKTVHYGTPYRGITYDESTHVTVTNP